MTIERYQFPLNDTDFYNGKVIFQVRIEEPPELSFGDDASTQVSGSNPDNPNFIDVIKSVVGGISYTTKTVTKLGPKATLYLPNSLQFQDGVVYERVDLGRIGGAAELATQNGGSIGESLTRSFTDQISSLTELFNRSLSPDAARLAAVRAAKFAGANYGEGVQSALRVTTNPNTRQLFKEVNIRGFSFSFRLIPVSKEEAEMAKSLIKFFRTELYPDDSVNIDVGGGATVPVGYKFPNTFDISFKHKDQDIIYKLLPCYLTAVSTTYNPTGMGFFEDGNFTEIEISLDFRESRTLTKKLVRDGGY